MTMPDQTDTPPAGEPTGTDKVDFFIVGAMKSGTSSLRDMLRQHPEIDLYRGEIHYFDKPDLYEQGPDWYHGHFGPARPGLLRGDKSPSYSLDPKAPARMAQYNPEARLIWILRNPVDRLISNYHHSKRRNPEAMGIEDALDRAEELAARNSTAAYLYRSQYDRHLENFLKHFERGRHNIVIFEDFVADPETPSRDLCGWLGIDASVPLDFPHSNRNKPAVKQNFPVAPEVTARLAGLLAPTIAYIEDFIGRDLPAWRR